MQLELRKPTLIHRLLLDESASLPVVVTLHRFRPVPQPPYRRLDVLRHPAVQLLQEGR